MVSNCFAGLTNSDPISFLQSRKKVSGEISKEPFLDVFLTDLEQSSFSLICDDSVFKNEGLLPSKLKVTYLKIRTSNCLFSDTELGLTKKSFVNTQLSSQKELGLRSFHSFETNNKYSFIKPFLITFVPKFTIKCNRKNENVNLLFVSTQSKQSSDLRCAKVYTPSHSAGQYLQPFQVVKTPIFFKTASQYQLANKLYLNRLTNRHFLQENRQISCILRVGDYVHCGDKIGYLSKTPIVITESGKLLRISHTQMTIQKMQPVLFYSQAEIHVESGEWVKRGTPILTLTHQTLVTGDIVQGIPRIEQLFEASTAAPPGVALQESSSSSDHYVKSSLTHFSKKSSISNYLRSRNSSHRLPLTSTLVQNGVEAELRHAYVQSEALHAHEIVQSEVLQNEVLQHHLRKTKDRNDKISKNNGDKGYDLTGHSATENKPIFLYKTLQSQVRETFRKKWDQLPLPVAVRQSLEDIQQVIVESIQKVYISQGVLIADKHIEIIVRQMSSKAQVFDGGSTGLLIDEILSLQQIEDANISTPGQKALYLPVIMGLTRSALSSDSFVSAASFQETTRVLSRDAIAGKTDFLRGLKEKVIIGDLIDAGTGLDTFYVYSLFSRKIFENKFREILDRKLTHKTLKRLVHSF